MSFIPTHDPIAGDKHSCDALEMVVVPRSRDLGGFNIRRALPHARRQMVGPFIFFDHFGPMQLLAGQGMDIAPHPHIGLATVSYLFDGALVHRDSEGHVQEIAPGAMNLMTAGRGIAHSERTPPRQRKGPHQLYGLQTWIALPPGKEESDPDFQHYDATMLPTLADHGIRARVIAGSSFGLTSPVALMSDWFYVEVILDAESSAPLDTAHEDRAIYVVEGEVEIAGERFSAPQLLIFRPGDPITVRAVRPARMMFLGGATMEGHRHIWWNFVASSRERIEQAKEDWKSGRFKAVPDETTLIPLPERHA